MTTLNLAWKLNMYAYDVYILVCAQNLNAPLITLDKKLSTTAHDIGINILEIMNIYTVSEAKNHLSAVLSRAESDGEVLLKRKDGRHFIIRPEPIPLSPLDIDGVTTGITSAEIITTVRECRER